MSVENPTPAEIRTNHERVTKAVEKLNRRAWAGTRYLAVLPEGKPGLIRRESRPANAPYRSGDYTHDYTTATELYDVIGVVVDYSNKYDAPKDTMCGRVYRKGERVSELYDRRNYARRDIERAEKALEDAQKALEEGKRRLATREAEIAAEKAEPEA